MPQFAFVVAYGPDNPENVTTIPMRLMVRYVDTDENAISNHEATYSIATTATANQIMAAGVAAIKAVGAAHGYANLGTNSIIGPQLIRGG